MRVIEINCLRNINDIQVTLPNRRNNFTETSMAAHVIILLFPVNNENLILPLIHAISLFLFALCFSCGLHQDKPREEHEHLKILSVW